MKYKVKYNRQNDTYYILEKKHFKYHLAYVPSWDEFIITDGNSKVHHTINEFLFNHHVIKYYPEYIKNQVFYLYAHVNEDK